MFVIENKANFRVCFDKNHKNTLLRISIEIIDRAVYFNRNIIKTEIYDIYA